MHAHRSERTRMTGCTTVDSFMPGLKHSASISARTADTASGVGGPTGAAYMPAAHQFVNGQSIFNIDWEAVQKYPAAGT